MTTSHRAWRRSLALATVAAIAMAPVTARASSVSARVDQLTSIGRTGASASALAERVAEPVPATSSPVGHVDPGGDVAHFATLAVGSPLPSDETCASAVRAAVEIRPDNVLANHTAGVGTAADMPRVTGNFVGTTDEIMQWIACKWGIDEDIVRAQIAKESAWHQDAHGDLTDSQSSCHPAFRTGSGPCPESIGLGQVRFLYHGAAFANGNAINSSAHNLDYTYAVWRSCFDGQLTWLNGAERGSQYAAGDVWGCVGVWFAGRWRTQPALTYIAAVQDYVARRVWDAPDFVDW